MNSDDKYEYNQGLEMIDSIFQSFENVTREYYNGLITRLSKRYKLTDEELQSMPLAITSIPSKITLSLPSKTETNNKTVSSPVKPFLSHFHPSAAPIDRPVETPVITPVAILEHVAPVTEKSISEEIAPQPEEDTLPDEIVEPFQQTPEATAQSPVIKTSPTNEVFEGIIADLEPEPIPAGDADVDEYDPTKEHSHSSDFDLNAADLDHDHYKPEEEHALDNSLQRTDSETDEADSSPSASYSDSKSKSKYTKQELVKLCPHYPQSEFDVYPTTSIAEYRQIPALDRASYRAELFFDIVKNFASCCGVPDAFDEELRKYTRNLKNNHFSGTDRDTVEKFNSFMIRFRHMAIEKVCKIIFDNGLHSIESPVPEEQPEPTF